MGEVLVERHREPAQGAGLRLTPTGRQQLDEEEAKWQKLLQGVRHVLRFAKSVGPCSASE